MESDACTTEMAARLKYSVENLLKLGDGSACEQEPLNFARVDIFLKRGNSDYCPDGLSALSWGKRQSDFGANVLSHSKTESIGSSDNVVLGPQRRTGSDANNLSSISPSPSAVKLSSIQNILKVVREKKSGLSVKSPEKDAATDSGILEYVRSGNVNNPTSPGSISAEFPLPVPLKAYQRSESLRSRGDFGTVADQQSFDASVLRVGSKRLNEGSHVRNHDWRAEAQPIGLDDQTKNDAFYPLNDIDFHSAKRRPYEFNDKGEFSLNGGGSEEGFKPAVVGRGGAISSYFHDSGVGVNNYCDDGGEPEWMTAGPEDMFDTVELRGFSDDERVGAEDEMLGTDHGDRISGTGTFSGSDFAIDVDSTAVADANDIKKIKPGRPDAVTQQENVSIRKTSEVDIKLQRCQQTEISAKSDVSMLEAASESPAPGASIASQNPIAHDGNNAKSTSRFLRLFANTNYKNSHNLPTGRSELAGNADCQGDGSSEEQQARSSPRENVRLLSALSGGQSAGVSDNAYVNSKPVRGLLFNALLSKGSNVAVTAAETDNAEQHRLSSSVLSQHPQQQMHPQLNHHSLIEQNYYGPQQYAQRPGKVMDSSVLRHRMEMIGQNAPSNNVLRSLGALAHQQQFPYHHAPTQVLTQQHVNQFRPPNLQQVSGGMTASSVTAQQVQHSLLTSPFQHLGMDNVSANFNSSTGVRLQMPPSQELHQIALQQNVDPKLVRYLSLPDDKLQQYQKQNVISRSDMFNIMQLRAVIAPAERNVQQQNAQDLGSVSKFYQPLRDQNLQQQINIHPQFQARNHPHVSGSSQFEQQNQHLLNMQSVNTNQWRGVPQPARSNASSSSQFCNHGAQLSLQPQQSHALVRASSSCSLAGIPGDGTAVSDASFTKPLVYGPLVRDPVVSLREKASDVRGEDGNGPSPASILRSLLLARGAPLHEVDQYFAMNRNFNNDEEKRQEYFMNVIRQIQYSQRPPVTSLNHSSSTSSAFDTSLSSGIVAAHAQNSLIDNSHTQQVPLPNAYGMYHNQSHVGSERYVVGVNPVPATTGMPSHDGLVISDSFASIPVASYLPDSSSQEVTQSFQSRTPGSTTSRSFMLGQRQFRQ